MSRQEGASEWKEAHTPNVPGLLFPASFARVGAPTVDPATFPTPWMICGEALIANKSRVMCRSGPRNKKKSRWDSLFLSHNFFLPPVLLCLRMTRVYVGCGPIRPVAYPWLRSSSPSYSELWGFALRGSVRVEFVSAAAHLRND